MDKREQQAPLRGIVQAGLLWEVSKEQSCRLVFFFLFSYCMGFVVESEARNDLSVADGAAVYDVIGGTRTEQVLQRPLE